MVLTGGARPPIPDINEPVGVEVYIDLASVKKGNNANLFYVVVDGKRYFGSNPQELAKTLRDQLRGTPLSNYGKPERPQNVQGAAVSANVRPRRLSLGERLGAAAAEAAAKAAAKAGTAAASVAGKAGKAAFNVTRKAGTAAATAAGKAGKAGWALGKRGTSAAATKLGEVGTHLKGSLGTAYTSSGIGSAVSSTSQRASNLTKKAKTSAQAASVATGKFFTNSASKATSKASSLFSTGASKVKGLFTRKNKNIAENLSPSAAPVRAARPGSALNAARRAQSNQEEPEDQAPQP
jgi:hypothetical protein